jgi:hypothetical protein
LNAPPWIAAVLVVAALQVIEGLAGIVAVLWTGGEFEAGLPLWIFPLQMVVFSSAATVLAASGRRDERALYLGVVFALIATSFARVPTLHLEALVPHALPLAALRGLRVDALLPLFVWLFFRDFPRAIGSPRARLVARFAIGASAVAGGALLAVNFALVLAGDARPVLGSLDPQDRRSPYWALVYGLTVLAFPFAYWRTRAAPREERQRAAIFASGIAAAAVPYSLFVLAGVVSQPFMDWQHSEGRDLILPAVELLILSIPMTTAYAVLVDRALPIRVILRQALQHGLARGVVAVGASLPFVWIVWSLYPRRGEPLADLLSGPQALALAAVAGAGFAGIRLRERARSSIDRTFFREKYDARRILLDVAVRSRKAARAGDLASLLASEIDRALHLQGIAVLFADPLSGELLPASGAVRALPRGSALVAQLAGAAAPVEVDLERAGSALRALPEEDRHWLADADVRLLVPLVSSGDELIGAIALGPKRSELPFTGEDREFLAAIGAAGAATLENRLKLGTGSRPPGRGEITVATELDAEAGLCGECDRLHPGSLPACPACGATLRATGIPLVLHGKFELERRVGEGGMGVVYRARDRELGRVVAVKTLPTASPDEAVRLRREARAMAAVVHPNLVMIYSAETWKGTPLLITEFLEGGTLAERLVPGTGLPSLADTLRLGSELCEALERVHRAGILHRDIKPSNIGYTTEGVPKLLDFGLARMVGEAGGAARALTAGRMGVGTSALRTTVSEVGIIGTPLYMSPEAIRGDAPDAGFDLWSLAVVLYEAIAGWHPVERTSWGETLRAITRAQIPPLRDVCARATPALEEFFRDALHLEARRRPGSAAEFGQRWVRAASDLTPG